MFGMSPYTCMACMRQHTYPFIRAGR
jgi:hypothetical protein